MDKIRITLNEGRTLEVQPDERVYVDRSAYQYEAGWIAFDPAKTDDDPEYFISDSGEVYTYGTGDVIGEAPVLAAAAERYERELDKLYATEGM